MEIDRNSIILPNIKISEMALIQINLIIENDFTVKDQYFRVQITGKECDGFVYSTGFTTKHVDDFTLEVVGIKVIIDPFSAYYLKDTNIDYVQDFAKEEEGFTVTNHDQENFTGKFWKTAPEKIPPLINDKTPV